ncbi:hypothetical protein wTpre_221 [Wolbachia endosymbiont of Trichogramma pretiosum]|nr:hypothetical protein wTpre_221 [Wolbachia endosymbiont of Trichogramma pretiosum]
MVFFNELIPPGAEGGDGGEKAPCGNGDGSVGVLDVPGVTGSDDV